MGRKAVRFYATFLFACGPGLAGELELEFPNARCQDPEAKLRFELASGEALGPELAAPLPQATRVLRPPAGTRLIFLSNRCFVPVTLIGVETPNRLSLWVAPLAHLSFRLERSSFWELRLAVAKAFRWGMGAFPWVSRCEQLEASTKCPVPADRIHVRLAGDRGAPHYFFDLQPEAGKTIDLGKLPLRLGGSLVGWVEAPRGERLSRSLEVLAQLEGDSSGVPGSTPSFPVPVKPLSQRRSPVAANGFFQVVGLPAGFWDLEVSDGQRRVGKVADVFVRNERETQVEEPVALSWPRGLQVQVEPPTDPEEKPWTIELHRRIARPEAPLDFGLDPVMAKVADLSGQASFEGLPPDLYAIVVRQGGEVLEVEPVDVDAEGELFEKRVTIQLPLVQVSGQLRCAGVPLEGPIRVSTQRKGRQFDRRLELDEEGRFSGWIAGGDAFAELLLFDTSPRQTPTFSVASKRLRMETKRWEVDIDLEGAEVSGKVIGPNGEPQANASVSVARFPQVDPAAPRESSTATKTDPEGRFRFRCVPPGKWLITAAVAENEDNLLQSSSLSLDLEPRRKVSGLILRLEKKIKRKLMVSLRRGGQPVLGQGLCAESGSERFGWFSFPTEQDRNGLLVFRVLRSPVSCMFWDEHGIVFRRLEATERGSVVAVDFPPLEATATLILRNRLPESDTARVLPRWLIRDNIQIPLWAFFSAWPTKVHVPELGSELVSGLEAGEYLICGLRSGCQPLLLLPGTTATVDSEEMEPGTSR